MYKVWRIETPSRKSQKWLMDFHYTGRRHEIAEHPAAQRGTGFHILRSGTIHSREAVVQYFKKQFGVDIVDAQIIADFDERDPEDSP